MLVTGADGQVGFELRRALAPLGEVVACGRRECDLADGDAVRRVVREVAPAVVVNAAAYTAVDKAESEPELAEAVNGVGPGVLGGEAARVGALVVHYSTDYVFDGSGEVPWREEDEARPLGVYGRTKLAGERALAASGARHVVLRTSWVHGVWGRNFVKTMLRLIREREELGIVADQHGAPTGAALIADVSAHVVGRFSRGADVPSGVYHLAAAGHTTWHGLARHVAERAQRAGWPLKASPERILPIETSAYPTPAARPANSRLDTEKLRATFGLHLPDWRDGVDRALDVLLER